MTRQKPLLIGGETVPLDGQATGAGREGVRYAMEEMTEPRLIVIDPGH
jgi:hypothetical protein